MEVKKPATWPFIAKGVAQLSKRSLFSATLPRGCQGLVFERSRLLQVLAGAEGKCPCTGEDQTGFPLPVNWLLGKVHIHLHPPRMESHRESGDYFQSTLNLL